VAVLRYRRLLLILILGMGLLLLLPQTQAYVSHFIQGVEVEERSMQMRMGEYRDALKLIRRYPWLGVGFVGAPDIDLYLGVASIYFTLASQMGLVGLLAFLLVMATFFAVMGEAWVHLPPESATESMLLGYGAAVFGSLIGGLADHTLLTYPHATAFLWLTVALALVAVRLGKSSRKFHGHFNC
jgi:O-antigen ligase